MPRAQAKPELILRAALGLFSEKTYAGAAMPEVAAAAGVGMGTIYRHFSDKAALVNALYQALQAEFAGQVLAPLPRELAPRQQFEAVWHRIAGWVEAAPRAAIFLKLHAHGAYLDEKSRAAARANEAALRNFIQAGIQSGVLASGSAVVASALLEGAVVSVVRALADGRPMTAVEVEALGALVWNGLTEGVGQGDVPRAA